MNTGLCHGWCWAVITIRGGVLVRAFSRLHYGTITIETSICPMADRGTQMGPMAAHIMVWCVGPMPWWCLRLNVGPNEQPNKALQTNCMVVVGPSSMSVYGWLWGPMFALKIFRMVCSREILGNFRIFGLNFRDSQSREFKTVGALVLR